MERRLLRFSHNGKDPDSGRMVDTISDDTPQMDDLSVAIPEDVVYWEDATNG